MRGERGEETLGNGGSDEATFSRCKKFKFPNFKILNFQENFASFLISQKQDKRKGSEMRGRREEGGGSREQGAGSREQGGGRR